MLLVGLLCALSAAGCNSAAGLLEAVGQRRADGAVPLRQPLYVLGLAVDGLGFVLTVVALRHLPVFAVQAVLAGSIAITAVVGARLQHTRMSTPDRVATVCCIGGLAVVAAAAGAGAPRPVAGSVGIVLLGAVPVLAAAAVLAWRRRDAAPAAVLAGLAFGGVALAVRAVHLQTTVAADLRTLPTQPAVYAAAGFAVVGIVAYTLALARGDVATVTGVLVVTEAVVPGLVGLALLGDPVRPGWGPALALGLLVAVGGVVLLIRSPAQRMAPAQARLGRRPYRRAASPS